MKPSLSLLRSCRTGNRGACNAVRKIQALYAGSTLTFATIPKKTENPNRLPFTGTLLLVDVASDKPPHGSESHRIYVSKQAAIKAMPDLIGQAINYQPDGLAAHASRHKVGVITKAWLEGNKVKVSGFIWIKDFPEARVLKNRDDLGMSMELADVYVEDEDADVWNLEKFSFTGGTILKKAAAAYTKTDLAAVAAAAEGKRGKAMAKPTERDRKVAAAHKDTGQRHRDNGGNLALMTQALGATMERAVSNAFAPVLSEIKASNERYMEGLEEIKTLHLINAASDNGGDELEDEGDDEIVLHAKGEDDASASASDAEEMEAGGEASASDDEMEAARGHDDDDDDQDDSSSDMEAMEDMGLEDASQEPGEVNKDASSKGSKTKVTKPPTQGEHFSGNVATGRLHSSANGKGGKVKKVFPNLKSSRATSSSIHAATMIGELQASVKQIRRRMQAQAEQHATEVGGLRKKLKRMAAQAARFAELEGRHSRMSTELVNLGEKVGVDFNEARVSGSKFSVRAFDTILAAGEQQGILLNPQQRIAMKMLAEEHGLLDEGVVDRIGRA